MMNDFPSPALLLSSLISAKRRFGIGAASFPSEVSEKIGRMSLKMRYAARVLGLLVLVAGAGTAMGAASVPLPPVVIIPGLCGSQMEARLTEAYDSAPHWYCPRGSKNSVWKVSPPQLVRVLVLGAEGRGFNPRREHLSLTPPFPPFSLSLSLSLSLYLTC